MSPYEMIKDQISKTVPFASHAGVELVEVGEGLGEARLIEAPTTLNHIGSQHAGALFTLGEAASGAAMAGGLAPVLLSAKPVAANASIRYLKVAKGDIYAKGWIASDGSPSNLIDALKESGTVQFPVKVEMTNSKDEVVAEMNVDWHVRYAS